MICFVQPSRAGVPNKPMEMTNTKVAEDKIGGLDPGKWADFVIVDRDPTQINEQELA